MIGLSSNIFNIFNDIVFKVDSLFQHNFSFKDIPILLPVRFTLLLFILEKVFPFQWFDSSEKVELPISLFTTNPFFSEKNYKFLFFTDNTNCSAVKDGKYFDVIHDYFALVYEDKSVIIQHSNNKNLREPRFFKNVYYNDYIDYKVQDIAKTKVLYDKDEKSITKFCKELQYLFPQILKNEVEIIKKRLEKFAVTIPIYYNEYIRLYDKLKPSVVFLTEAIDGHKLDRLLPAKEMSIPVCEFQHGLISLYHFSYNYSQSVIENKNLAKFFPDYILTFGDFWNTQMRNLSKVRTIGNPHIFEKRKTLKKENSDLSRKKILVLSQWTVTDRFVKITEELSRELSQSDYQIIFRPHPNEISSKNRYKHLEALENVSLQENGDVLDHLYDSEIIICYYSTSIFESLAFNKVPLILDDIWSKLYIPNDIGIRFSNIQELIEIIKNHDESKFTVDVSKYWESNWKNNYIDFLKNELQIVL